MNRSARHCLRAGFCTAARSWDGTGDQLGHATTTVYDAHGNVQASIDPLGNHTTYVYDSLGRPVATEDARANFSTQVYDSYGRVAATQDALGNLTTTVFDSQGRVAASEDARGHFVTTVYDSYGRVAATEDQLGTFVTTIYDSSGRFSATQDGRGNLVTTVYDAYGRAAATEDSRGGYATTIYDGLGRVSATEDQLGHLTTFLYDAYGRQSATVDPLGHATTAVYDAYGRDVASVDPLGQRTTMVLDALGRQTKEIDADGNVTTFLYDNLSRVDEQISPTGGVTTMAYDADGRLASQTSPNSTRIDYGYDANGNNLGETWHNADASTSYATFVYDADNRQTSASNSSGAYTLTYDATGEVTNVKGLWGAQLTMTYDAAGHRTGVQDNFGGVTTNVYDANGNLTQQLFGGASQTPMRIDQSYDANNELTDVIRYSDLAGTTKVATTSHVYDAAGELTNQIDRNGGGTSIANYTYVYDAAGRVTSEKLNGAAPTTYTYDADNELTGDGTSSDTYDAEGNRTNTGYSTTTGNEVQSDGTWDYGYDASGNETYKVAISGGATWEYGYDNKNELVKAQLWASDPRVYGTGDTLEKEVDYQYDIWGLLIERDDYPTGTGSPTVTRYAQDGWNPALAGQTGTANFNVWAELDGSNALQTRYLHGDQVDQLFARQDSLVAYWYLTDRQGSVRDVLDNSGNVEDAISYDGFGNILSETASTYRGSYAWSGRQLDIETGLQYNRARWYDSSTGRWVSQDPLGFAAGDSNLYRYTNNSPATSVDPSGLSGDLVAPWDRRADWWWWLPEPSEADHWQQVKGDPGLNARLGGTPAPSAADHWQQVKGDPGLNARLNGTAPPTIDNTPKLVQLPSEKQLTEVHREIEGLEQRNGSLMCPSGQPSGPWTQLNQQPALTIPKEVAKNEQRIEELQKEAYSLQPRIEAERSLELSQLNSTPYSRQQERENREFYRLAFTVLSLVPVPGIQAFALFNLATLDVFEGRYLGAVLDLVAMSAALRAVAIAPTGSGLIRDPRSLAQFTLAERLDMRIRYQALVSMLERGEDVAMRTGSMSAQLMGDLTVATGREVALIRIGNQRFLRLGGVDSAFVGDATRLIAHTHPSGVLRFSTGAESDMTVFTQILTRQRSSILVAPDGTALRLPILRP